jgi:hypothetical protein
MVQRRYAGGQKGATDFANWPGVDGKVVAVPEFSIATGFA